MVHPLLNPPTRTTGPLRKSANVGDDPIRIEYCLPLAWKRPANRESVVASAKATYSRLISSVKVIVWSFGGGVAATSRAIPVPPMQRRTDPGESQTGRQNRSTGDPENSQITSQIKGGKVRATKYTGLIGAVLGTGKSSVLGRTS